MANLICVMDQQRQTPSGNSFNSLVPFSKFPYKCERHCQPFSVLCWCLCSSSKGFLSSVLCYRDSDYGNEEVAESVKEEKRRKQLEAIAEDLFNSERVCSPVNIMIVFFSITLASLSGLNLT